jgi:hypothetical protein
MLAPLLAQAVAAPAESGGGLWWKRAQLAALAELARREPELIDDEDEVLLFLT